MIEKAGGVIVRIHNEEKQIYIIHRARHDDWSLPKGHIDEGEDVKTAALREIAEETGFNCSVVQKLPDYVYTLPSGEEASVAMYEVEVLDDTAEKDDESDKAEWVSVQEAIQRISYPTLAKFVEQHIS